MMKTKGGDVQKRMIFMAAKESLNNPMDPLKIGIVVMHKLGHSLGLTGLLYSTLCRACSEY